ncbi:ParA family protein [Streptococcus iniae]|uniref:ParA family protein n=1 Tax=Streptococcus iniae TaxID=1346 RepID=UPI0002D6BC00|nr:ParA family protein [Streptococcus iniae]ESR10517.1 peptide transporter [Streptococcus iniae IUSA1]RMI73078.1 ParA family protein [Streptococcus iniae]HEK4517275.1 ParA family protein [Streptococcus iniae]
MKLVSFVAIKGGVGKTTLALLTGQYLADKGKKILFIDLDHQCNLTHFYDIYKDSETVSNIFTDSGNVNFLPITPNIDLLPGSMRLDDTERKLETDPNQNMILYDWLDDNYESKNLEQYDYVIIDCRPDFGIATRNAIAVSHALINPIIPSDFAYEGKENLEIRLDNYRKTEIARPSRESLITAKLYYLPNMIKHNTEKSKSLMKVLEGQDSVMSQIPQKELFNKASSENTMIDMMNNTAIRNEHKEFFKFIEKSLNEIELTINNC